MDQEKPGKQSSLVIHISDPDFIEKMADFLMARYCHLRETMLAQAQAAASAQPSPPQGETQSDGRDEFFIGPENLPEKFIDLSTYLTVMKVRQELMAMVHVVPPETNDPLAAATALVNYSLNNCAIDLASRMKTFLALEWQCHPEYRLRTVAVKVLDIQGKGPSFVNRLADILLAAYTVNKLHENHGLLPNAQFAPALVTLQSIGACFFSLVRSVYPVSAVMKCMNAFHCLMLKFGSREYDESFTTFRMCAKSMILEVMAAERKALEGELQKNAISCEAYKELSEKLDLVSDGLKANTAAAAKLERTVRDASAQQVQTAKNIEALALKGNSELKLHISKKVLRDPKWPSALKRVVEPHRSQLMAVILHTRENKISPPNSTEENPYTLADAVRAVWKANCEKWVKNPKCYGSCDSLRSACYSLRKHHPKDDPFAYRR